MARSLALEIVALQLTRLRLQRAVSVLDRLVTGGPTSSRGPRPPFSTVRRSNPRQH